jgi:hypothetical protein
LEEKIAAPVWKSDITAVGDPLRSLRNILLQKLALTSLTSGGSSVCIFRSRTQAMGVNVVYCHIDQPGQCRKTCRASLYSSRADLAAALFPILHCGSIPVRTAVQSPKPNHRLLVELTSFFRSREGKTLLSLYEDYNPPPPHVIYRLMATQT